jgi:uncharacterized protein YprB with RNaseH-like and TPR domain
MSIETLKRYYRLPRSVQVAPQKTTTSPRGTNVPLEELLIGKIERLGESSCFVLETAYDLSARCGSHTLGELKAVRGERLALITKDPELAYFDLQRTVFLDTETTGLSQGTGTLVFLVGAGYLDGTYFVIRQFFLRSIGEEAPYLKSLASFLERFSAIVTFNGKAFDWPLLEQRYIYNRDFRKPPLLNPLHLDLLHPARRLWKPRLESCALGSLENHVLGVKRTREDVPGYLIPSLYFKFQRTGDGRPLAGVFYHNLQDILSLAALAIHMDQVMSDPLGGSLDHALDFYSLGKVFDRAGEAELAAACYEEALRRQIDSEHRYTCLVALGAVQKRQRWWDSALHTWDRLLDSGGSAALHALVEMAKYHEHVERDYHQALDCVEQALMLFELRTPGWPVGEREALERRLARLVGRAARNRAWYRTHV